MKEFVVVKMDFHFRVLRKENRCGNEPLDGKQMELSLFSLLVFFGMFAITGCLILSTGRYADSVSVKHERKS